MALSLYTPTELAQRLAARIQDDRLLLELTQAELSSRAGIALKTYKRFEATGEISLVRLASVLTVLGREQDLEAVASPRPPQTASEMIALKKKRQRGRSRKPARTSE